MSTPIGLTYRTYTVELRKRSEASFGIIVVSDITTDSALGVNTDPVRNIEVISDSITVRYSLDCTYPYTNNAALEDNPKMYMAPVANALGADYRVMA